MFKLIGTISDCITTTITSLTQAVVPLTNSLELGAKSIELHAQELYEDTNFECQKNRNLRAKQIDEFNAELQALVETKPID